MRVLRCSVLKDAGISKVTAVIGFTTETAVWTKGKLRKEAKCANCEDPLVKGSDVYRPLGNQSYRALRLCVACATEIHAEVF